MPLFAECYNSQFGPFNVNSMALIYRGVYLYNEKDSPRIAYVLFETLILYSKNGKSEIALDIKITPRNDTTSLYGTIEVCLFFT